ncbi:DUF4198 domain-containing protein [Palleronia caenipelagi]|uniref:DUF4198 domain-containing protein n=1 Tax=Palleronia caenipelagi TaxID=2489174 RepID=A0A547Q9K3_9RHOB|nr:DUF4198 domain-containing protein [Palleronia caenipelagi]TRD23066.1 DUF4198 domain-containing protein [Palleronia caenipelagi]
MKLLFSAFLVSCSAFAGAATAHEFWIEPQDFTLAPGEDLVAAIKVGQEFRGTSYAYIPANFRRFDLVTNGGDTPNPVEMQLGDRPALEVPIAKPGLATILHVTKDYKLTWDSWDKFDSFLRHKAADWVIEAHAERGFAQVEGVTEGYTRYGKSLVSVGDGAGEDRVWGLEVEIVALENPYTGDMSDGLDVQVFYDGEPRDGEQVEIFERDQLGDVSIQTVTTDQEGRATVPVTPGHAYLLDSVVLREPDAEMRAAMDVQWESLWASLTFAIPE